MEAHHWNGEKKKDFTGTHKAEEDQQWELRNEARLRLLPVFCFGDVYIVWVTSTGQLPFTVKKDQRPCKHPTAQTGFVTLMP